MTPGARVPMFLPTNANQAPAIGRNGAGPGGAVLSTRNEANAGRNRGQLALLKSLIERPERHQAEFVVTDLGRAVLDVLLQNGPR
jgi:hypothetical protein